MRVSPLLAVLVVTLAACNSTQAPPDAASLAATLPSQVGEVALEVTRLTDEQLETFGPAPLADAVEARFGAFELGHAAVASGDGINILAYALPGMDSRAVAFDYLERLADSVPEAQYSEPEDVTIEGRAVLSVRVVDSSSGHAAELWVYPVGGTIYLLQILDPANVPLVLAGLP